MAPVGVPGLVLGGGISFFSNKVGWACDNVAAYELVTASGLVVTATPKDFPDLYWALRGGGNNFGIVTNFKLDAFPLGKMWGGQRIFTPDNFTGVLDALYNFATIGSSKDTSAAEIVVRSFYHCNINLDLTRFSLLVMTLLLERLRLCKHTTTSLSRIHPSLTTSRSSTPS
jgi:FAD/FMN-containing dehydrogenase